jgi:hypothetical protein
MQLTASLATLASFCFTSRGNLLAFPPDCDGCSGSSPSAVGGQSVTSKRPNNETELDDAQIHKDIHLIERDFPKMIDQMFMS